MIRHFLDLGDDEVMAEGTLYKRLILHGQVFELRYGYYEDRDRNNPTLDPMPIYPDFLKHPQFTQEGFAFVTKMQDACPHYRGEAFLCKECAECAFFQPGEDLIGICVCEENKGTPTTAVLPIQGGTSK